MAKIKIYQHEKRKIFYAVAIAVILLAIIVLFAEFSKNIMDYTSARTSIDDVEDSVRNNRGTADYFFALIGTDGVVINANLEGYSAGDTVDLSEVTALHGTIADDDSGVFYTKPYTENGVQTATLLVKLPLSSVQGKYVIVSGTLALAAGIPLVVVLALIIVQYMNFQKKTEAPIKKLHAVILELVKGNYEKPVELDSGTEDLAMAFHDVELLREELLKNRENEKQYREREKTLLVSLTHDLKTPLSVVGCCAECIRDGIPAPETGGGYSERILNNTEKMTRLIDQIIESTKVEMADFSMEREDVEAPQLFKKPIKAARELAADKGVDFSSGEVPKMLLSVDKFRVEQIFQNIVGNAVKFTDSGGKIFVDFAETDGYLTVSVSDSGCGISAEDLPFVFDKFYRGEKSRNREGNGLGLSIAKNLVEKHGGTVRCESVLGEGTTMTFTLPAAAE